MHEMSLVQGLFQQIRELALENNASKVITITMEIGPMCGVVVDSFQFGYDILSAEDTMFTGAELIIEIPLVTYRCTECGHEEITAGTKPDQCQKCQDLFLIPEGGDDLILKQIEME